MLPVSPGHYVRQGYLQGCPEKYLDGYVAETGETRTRTTDVTSDLGNPRVLPDLGILLNQTS